MVPPPDQRSGTRPTKGLHGRPLDPWKFPAGFLPLRGICIVVVLLSSHQLTRGPVGKLGGGLLGRRTQRWRPRKEVIGRQITRPRHARHDSDQTNTRTDLPLHGLTTRRTWKTLTSIGLVTFFYGDRWWRRVRHRAARTVAGRVRRDRCRRRTNEAETQPTRTDPPPNRPTASGV